MKSEMKKKNIFARFIDHLKKIGFTNRLALLLVFLLITGLVMGFVLALLSIQYAYTGPLMCFTVVFTPIGTAVSIVLNSIVKKSEAENTWGSKGVKFAEAEARGFGVDENGVPVVSIPGTDESMEPESENPCG